MRLFSRDVESEGGAIIPITIGDEAKAVQIASSLMSRGIFIPAVRFPTVARGQARLRLTVTAAHSKTDVEQLLAALKALNIGTRN